MTQVSKLPLTKEVEERIFAVFLKTIADLKTPQEIKDFLDDFLSPVEKIMLAKRLAIAILLGKGYDYRSVREILRVTPGTIASVNLRLKYAGVGYKKIVEKTMREQKIGRVFDKVGNIVGMALGEELPPKGRSWSRWRKKKREEAREPSTPL